MKKDVKELTLFFIFSSAAIKVSSSDKICESGTLDFIKLTIRTLMTRLIYDKRHQSERLQESHKQKRNVYTNSILIIVIFFI